MCIAAAPAPLQLYLFVSCICLDLLCVHLLGGVLCCICAETVRRRAVVEVLMNAPEGHAPAQNDTAATTNSSAGSTAPDANVQSLIIYTLYSIYRTCRHMDD